LNSASFSPTYRATLNPTISSAVMARTGLRARRIERNANHAITAPGNRNRGSSQGSAAMRARHAYAFGRDGLSATLRARRAAPARAAAAAISG
jgi:hypothetical protein